MTTRAGLDALFKPQTFALIGASDKSTFSKLLISNLRAAGHGERVQLINPRSPIVHDQHTVPSCGDMTTPVDLAFVMVPAERVSDALRDAAAAGVRAAIILSSGYSEAGAEGIARQEEVVALGEELGITLLGPNVLGYINVLDGIPAMALSDPPKRPGSVALISQSGASCGAMKDFADMSGVDLSHVITVGNEAAVTIADIADYLLDDERVSAIAIFMESIKRPELFAQTARRAADLGKPIVVLKAGRSELAARAAASHTGALVGDDRVVDAMFDTLGVIRVDTVEDLLITAGIGAYTGPLRPGGLGMASISGGACDIVADLADSARLPIPEFAQATVAHLVAVMPEFGHAHNPLDVTGAALTTPGLWRASVAAVSADPSVAITIAVNSLPWREDGKPFYGEPFVREIGEGLTAHPGTPGIYVTQVSQPLGAETRALLERTGVPHTVTGLRGAINGIAGIMRWSRTLAERTEVSPTPAGEVADLPVDHTSLSEQESRDLLEPFGVPFVPSVIAAHGAAAAAAVTHWSDTPSAIKILSADIPHKSDVGGVALGVDADSVAERTDAMIAEVSGRCADAHIDGVLVSPMRPPATEMLVGVTRDDDWGLMLAVGFGGVLVEVLDDVVLAPLPVDIATVSGMLGKLRGRQLLDGVRGRPAADLNRLATAITNFAHAAASLGDRLESAEINPLRVDGADVEALDALVILRSPAMAETHMS